MIQGQRVEITLLDVYFLTGLLMLGVVGDLLLVLSHGEMLEELCDRHYYATVYVHGTHILTCDIEDLSTWAMVTLVLHVLGSMGNHNISRGQLQMVECAMRATYYGWAQTYLLVVRHQLNHTSASGG